MTPTNNKYVLDWINEMAEMTQPDKIVWIDGTEAQAEENEEPTDEQSFTTGPLNTAILGCTMK